MKESQSKILRNVLFKIYEWLSLDFREKTSFQTFYENEMTKIINDFKTKI